MTLLLAQRSRTDRSFERMYQRHVGDVYRYSLAVLRNPADAEDVTQTTFMNAYRAFQRGERPERAQNWLITIAHNVCRQRFRQSARRPAEVELDHEFADRMVADDVPSGTDIRIALGHLAFNQRAALVMRELEDRSYAEIAAILGLSVSAVETLIFRARRALREQLEGTLSCGEAELAISRQLDGRLPRAEKGALRAHLRQCKECATFARRQRGQRSALKALVAVPLPSSLGSFFGGAGGGAATLASGIAAKAAAVLVTAAVAGGVGYAGAHHFAFRAHRRAAAPTPAAAAVAALPWAGPVAFVRHAPAHRQPARIGLRTPRGRHVAPRAGKLAGAPTGLGMGHRGGRALGRRAHARKAARARAVYPRHHLAHKASAERHAGTRPARPEKGHRHATATAGRRPRNRAWRNRRHPPSSGPSRASRSRAPTVPLGVPDPSKLLNPGKK